MKIRISLLLVWLTVATAAVAQTPIAVGQFVVVNTDSTTPAILTNGTARAINITLIGRKANRTDNTGTVWVGFLATNDTQPIKVTSGAIIGITVPAGKAIMLASLYLDVETNGDGVMVLYE